MTEQNSVGLEAHNLVYGERQGTYGHPYHDFSRTAKIWEGIFGHDVTPEQVALCMIGVKLSRLCNTPDHHDSMVDIAGYAITYERVIDYRESENNPHITLVTGSKNKA